MWLKSLVLCLCSLVLYQTHAAPSSGKQVTSKDVDLQKIYEPTPPVTHRGTISIEYLDPVSNTLKQADLTLELYGTVVPKTVNNFVLLGHGVKAVVEGQDPKDVKTYSYRKSKISKVFPNSFIQGGVVAPDVGPFTIYGPKFEDENFLLKHDRPGRLAMAYFGPDSNTSEFIITTKVDGNEELDGKSVVFGQILSGLDELMDIVQYTETNEYGKPADETKFLYFVFETLKIGNIEELHDTYIKNVEAFRKGDSSLGTTLKDIFRKEKGRATTTAITSMNYYNPNHPVAQISLGLMVLAGCFAAYKCMNKKSRTVSLRRE
ncbi:peptidylprolyl isomerase family protein CPR4 [Saccharomyces eubayanus]|uniref:peptidylprolyl isomerase family protein CPR4 n=1 Tax=Saccharomyces eubayanus TaxID=1080349 RepID=UPI0006C10CC0|nr:CPR4-like protein [Saccharomyces eubayanus]KOH00720.1 CPR4-like protein [Saccharomyces eubayanus]